MLYIASALTPTPILESLSVANLTPSAAQSLVVAKPDRVQVWDVTEEGLTYKAELETWGNVISIAQDAVPHLLVLVSPPNARLLLVKYSSTPSPCLIVTSHIPLTPPTPSLRQAEFFTAVITQNDVALVSLWIGVLTCAEIEVEKDKDAKKRRSSIAAGNAEPEDKGKRLRFKNDFNINIREHNLTHLAFLPPSPSQVEPQIAFLWLSSTSKLLLQARKLSLVAHSFVDVAGSVNVVSPGQNELDYDEDTDFNEIPYACPAARRVVPITHDSVVIVGDEHCVMWRLWPNPVPRRPSNSHFASPTSGPTASTGATPPTKPSHKRKSSKDIYTSPDKSVLRPVWRARQGLGTVLAATLVHQSANAATMVLGDEKGTLTAIGWELEEMPAGRDSPGSVQLRVVNLGASSPPSSITYLDSSHIFLASACGDSSLLQLQAAPSSRTSDGSPVSKRARISGHKGKGRARDSAEGQEWTVAVYEDQGSAEVKERWMNLAPLKDFCVVEEESGGVSHLVTASGMSTSNSLRIIRSGVGLEDVAQIDSLTNLTGLFPMEESEGSTASLLVSTSGATGWLDIEPEIREMPKLHPEVASKPTLAARLLDDDSNVLHIAPQAVTVRCSLGGEAAQRWEPPAGDEIIDAAISEGYAAVALRDGKLVFLEASGDGLSILIEFTISAEISAIAMLSNAQLPSPIVAVSTWTAETFIYSLDHLTTAAPPVTLVTEEHYTTSLLMQPSKVGSSSGTRLLAGLSDGTLAVYELGASAEAGGYAVISKKASSLGSKPLKLFSAVQVTTHEDEEMGDSQKSEDHRIIAIGSSDRMSVIFENKDRVDFSASSRKDVSAAAGLHIPHLGGFVLAMASPSGLAFTAVNSLKKLTVQTMDTGDRSPTTLAFLPDSRSIAVGSTIRRMDSSYGVIHQASFLEIRDANTLSSMAEMSLNVREEVTCLKSLMILGKQILIVGTAVKISDDELDASNGSDSSQDGDEGRLRLIEVQRAPDGTCKLLVKLEQQVSGPPNNVCDIHGFLAIASDNQAVIYRVMPGFAGLREMSGFSSAFIARSLYTTPPSKLFPEPRLVVGDGMRSIFVLEVDPETAEIHGDQRDMATHQVEEMAGITDGDQPGVILADGHSNLLTMRLGQSIESAATFGLHEEGVRFRQGSLVPRRTAIETADPELLFSTADGRLGVIGQLTPAATKTLEGLQRNMDKYHTGPGGINWRTWRQGGTQLVQRDTAGFIDGDFVQKFLDTDLIGESEAEKIVNGATSHEAVQLAGDKDASSPASRADIARFLEAASGLH